MSTLERDGGGLIGSSSGPKKVWKLLWELNLTPQDSNVLKAADDWNLGNKGKSET